MKYNIKSKVNEANSTRMQLPDWAGRVQEAMPTTSGALSDRLSGSLSDYTRIRGVTVTQEASSFEPSGLMGSGIYDEPLTTDPSKMLDWARRTTPVENEPDVTDWMVPAKAYVATLKARSNEYARAGSAMTVAAGDPFTPGVRNGQMTFKSERGKTISENGQANIVAGNNNYSIDAPGNGVIVDNNLLGWAAASDIQDRQWVGSLMSIEELTNDPSQPIAFPSVGGNTGPLFMGHTQSRPSLINRVTMGLESSANQTLEFKLRSSNDYTTVLNSFTKEVPKGSSQMNFRVFAPSIDPMVAEIMPEDGTQAVLTDYTVRP